MHTLVASTLYDMYQRRKRAHSHTEIAQPINVGRLANFDLVHYNQSNFIGFRKYQVIGQLFCSIFPGQLIFCLFFIDHHLGSAFTRTDRNRPRKNRTRLCGPCIAAVAEFNYDAILSSIFHLSVSGHLYGKQLFTCLSLLVSLMASFCAVLFPTRCLG